MNNPFGEQSTLMQQFEQFKTQMASQGVDPRQKVQELLNTGQMSQQQFNQLSQLANLLMGRNKNG